MSLPLPSQDFQMFYFFDAEAIYNLGRWNGSNNGATTKTPQRILTRALSEACCRLKVVPPTTSSPW